MGTKVRKRSPLPIEDAETKQDRELAAQIDKQVGGEIAEIIDDELSIERHFDALPESTGERIRVLRATYSPDFWDYSLRRVYRLRMMGFTYREIAGQLHVSERTVYYMMAAARKLMAHQHSTLRPEQLLAEEMEAFALYTERVNAKMFTVSDVSSMTKLVGARMNLSDKKMRLLRDMGYFDAVQFGKLAGGGDGEGKAVNLAKAFERILLEASGDDDTNA